MSFIKHFYVIYLSTTLAVGGEYKLKQFSSFSRLIKLLIIMIHRDNWENYENLSGQVYLNPGFFSEIRVTMMVYGNILTS